MDNNFNSQSAQTAQSLQQQNHRLHLLLKLTNSITANLELKEVLRTIAANVREVMRCDAVNISLPGPEPGTFRFYAVDFPGGGEFLREEEIVTPGEDSPPMRAFVTLKPVIWSSPTGPFDDHGRRIAAAEGIRSVCFIPLLHRARALGILALVRRTEDQFTQGDIDSLSQAAGQIAIAIENLLVGRRWIAHSRLKRLRRCAFIQEQMVAFPFSKMTDKPMPMRRGAAQSRS